MEATIHNIEPNPKLHDASQFHGVPGDSLPDPPVDEDDLQCFRCSRPIGTLIPVFIGEFIVYFEDTEDHLETNPEFMDQMATSIPYIDRAMSEIRERIAQALKLSLANFTVILVVVHDEKLAFEYSGGVYLNCKPLLRYGEKELRHSIFFSLLHELTHRSHVAHDTFFADEFGKLVLHCSSCIG